jgi:hypothetical protein
MDRQRPASAHGTEVAGVMPSLVASSVQEVIGPSPSDFYEAVDDPAREGCDHEDDSEGGRNKSDRYHEELLQNCVRNRDSSRPDRAEGA